MIKTLLLSTLVLTGTVAGVAPEAMGQVQYESCVTYNHRAQTPDDVCVINGHTTSVGAYRAMTGAGPSVRGINDGPRIQRNTTIIQNNTYNTYNQYGARFGF